MLNDYRDYTIDVTIDAGNALLNQASAKSFTYDEDKERRSLVRSNDNTPKNSQPASYENTVENYCVE